LITILHPDVVFTDLGLAILSAWLGWRLWQSSTPMRTAGAIILWGLAVGALAGAVFHGFFPDGTRTRGGYLVWMPVPFSILVVATTLIDLSLRNLLPAIPVTLRRGIDLVYALAFAAVVILVDESFRMIVRFYAPALGLFLLTAVMMAARLRSRPWTLLAVSFGLSGVAAVLQQAKLGIDPNYFDHNAVYHVLQGVAVALLYRGFSRMEG
jgi:hypothetical protein